jgi:hypothetical protein
MASQMSLWLQLAKSAKNSVTNMMENFFIDGLVLIAVCKNNSFR